MHIQPGAQEEKKILRSEDPGLRIQFNLKVRVSQKREREREKINVSSGAHSDGRTGQWFLLSRFLEVQQTMGPNYPSTHPPTSLAKSQGFAAPNCVVCDAEEKKRGGGLLESL